MESPGEIAQYIKNKDEILILSHVIPDGDCLGSALALALALEQIGKKVAIVNEDEVPEMYEFLPGNSKISTSLKLKNIPQTVIMVDSSDLERVGNKISERLQDTTIINIDHHISNSHYGHLNFVDTKVSAAGELIYELLIAMDAEITPEIATNLYTAIVTDSGSFQYENVRPQTLEISAQLLRLGADMPTIREYLWETRSLINIRLLAKVLPELQLSEDGRIAWVSISKELQDQLEAKSEHCEDIINYPRSIAGVEVGLLFREIEPQVVKVGFRSKSRADVNMIAAKFDGGGHSRAAGCTVDGELQDVIPKVLEVVRTNLE